MRILTIILGIIILIASIVGVRVFSNKMKKTIKETVHTDSYNMNYTKEKKIYNVKGIILFVLSLIFGISSLICLIFIPASIHQVNAGEIAVVKVWGDAKEVREEGIYFDNFVKNKYEIYDTKVQQVEIDTETYSNDGQTMNITLIVQYKVIKDKIIEIAKTYGGLEMLESRIETVAVEKMKSVLAQKSAMTIIETRKTISPAIEESVRNAITEDYYVNITTVVLTDISFTEAFEKTVEDKMIAEQQKLKAQYEKEKAIIQAEQLLEVAKKEAEANIEKSKGDAEALQIMQEAWNSLAGEVKEAMLTQMAIEKWDGKLPETMVGDEFIRELMSFIS